uniref:Aminoacyl-tRNA hydrolase n=1 Tax=Panagrolaimus sp. JU765 TaxID=591449 RepID=A0AC34QPA0_9BILA
MNSNQDPPEPNSTPTPGAPTSQHPDIFDPTPGSSAPPPNPETYPRLPTYEEVVPDPFASSETASQTNHPSGLAEIPNEPSAPAFSESVSTNSLTEQVVVTPSDPADPDESPVDPVLLSTILEFGYDDYTARLAIRRTKGASADEAINWILDHSNDSDFQDSSDDDEEEEDIVMGAASSSIPSALQDIVMGAASSSIPLSLRSARTHKMVFVANMSLKMGAGKMAAQVGHACLGVYRTAMRTEDGQQALEAWRRHGVYRTAMRTEDGQQALEAWRRHGEVKIVVKGQSTEQLIDLFKVAKDLSLYAYLVQDAGYTQIPPGSRTVLGLFGPVEVIDQVTGNLKLM